MAPRTTLAPRRTIKPLAAVAVAQPARYRCARWKRDTAVIVVVVAGSIEIAVSENGKLRRIDRSLARSGIIRPEKLTPPELPSSPGTSKSSGDDKAVFRGASWT